MRPLLLCVALVLLVSPAAISTAHATMVTNLAATQHDGQTFLTWSTPPGTGWTYRVYTAPAPVLTLDDYWNTLLVGIVRDSSWCDRRLSQVTGTTYGYATDSSAAPLDSTQAVFVMTPADSGTVFYCVTAQDSGGTEDLTFQGGVNALTTPVSESIAPPRPIYQRTIPWDGHLVDIYTLWTSNRGNAFFPVMANRPGIPYDCSISRGGTGPADPMLIRPHHRGGSFLDETLGSNWPREWVLALDDPWMNQDGPSFWYGYHENYDIDSGTNQAPMSGTVRDYTMQRVVYTVLWARRNFPIDTTRVYAMGYSMGGIGSVFLALTRPDLIAAVESVVGKFDFAFEADPNTASEFNKGGSLRTAVDHLWGTVSTDLPTPEGPSVYDRLNDSWMAQSLERTGIPPILSYNGKNDIITGWAEKIPFYWAMDKYRHGGYYFWDTRQHLDQICSWDPMMNVRYLYRFRTNLSFPAITNCSADFNPGSGVASRGDSVGTFNGYVEWDTVVVDKPDSLQYRFWLRDLYTRWQTFPAPDSLTCNLTPRRVQSFPIHAGGLYHFVNRRAVDGVVMQEETDQADSLGLLTLYWVRLYKGGNIISFTTVEPGVSVGAAGPGPPRPLIALSRNPVAGPVALSVTWPRQAEATVELMDVAGRRVRTLFRGTALGPSRLTLDGPSLADGIYFVSARQGSLQATRRVTILH